MLRVLAVLAGVLFVSGSSAAAASLPRVERIGPKASSGPAVVTLRGGSWLRSTSEARNSIRPAIRRWRARGYVVFNVDYSPGAQGLKDVAKAFDMIIAQRGTERLCLYGESAGGHLALMLASLRDDVTCVVAAAAPLDLTRLGRDLHPIASYLFGPDLPLLQSWSPLKKAAAIKASVLLLSGVDDPVVPVLQQLQFKSLRPGTRLTLLRAGGVKWMHGTASRSALRKAHQIEARFMRKMH